MLVGVEQVLIDENFDAVLVPGDTNSTLAGALSAIKIQVPVIHLEAGLRSFDYRMPEEINRVLTDHISQLLITTSHTGTQNLIKEGIPKERIFEIGDTMVDAILLFKDLAEKKSKILSKINLKPKEFLLLTLHRAGNVDSKENLESILKALTSFEIPIIFPIHPRTKKNIENFGMEHYLNEYNIQTIEPVGYLDMLVLEKNAKIILTDSGGIQKEALTLNVPCITLRENTEWIETIQLGANRLVGSNNKLIKKELEKLLEKEVNYSWPNPYGDGKSREKIVEEIYSRFEKGLLTIPKNVEIKS